MPEDPGAPDKLSRKGKIPFEIGQVWTKGQSVATGQANVKRSNRHCTT